MTNPLILVRDVHFASTVIVAGTIFFDMFVAAPVLGTDLRLRATACSFGTTTRKIVLLFLGVSIASAIAWLSLLSARIAGVTIGEAIADGTMWVVVSGTRFGVAWTMRILCAIILLAVSLPPRRNIKAGTAAWRKAASTLLAGFYLGSLAFGGHGEEGLGFQRYIHLSADFLHLVAAGLWLGGLVPFALLLSYLLRLREEGWAVTACDAGGRFSTLGIVAVSILLMSGTINASFLVRGIGGLTGTRYGQLLLLKIALFIAMVCLAAINRQHLLPRLRGESEMGRNKLATQLLVRSAMVEMALGLIIIVIVGILGITQPATDMTSHLH